MLLTNFIWFIIHAVKNIRILNLTWFASSHWNLLGIFKKLLLVLLSGVLAWAYQAIRPPPPKICGSLDGPPVTSPRIKLRDGRHLSYLEHGVPKESAKYKIIFVHGFANSKHHNLFAGAAFPVLIFHFSHALIEDLKVYTVSFDRPGYGESDPDPNRTLKSLALDIEELADHLGLGSKFYVVGVSMGGELVWPCLKYIPHRLAGVTLVAPVVNHWWPNFPSNITKEVYSQMFKQDQWAHRVAHHLPWLSYWWDTQKWFPSSSVTSQSLAMFCPPVMEILSKFKGLLREAQMDQFMYGKVMMIGFTHVTLQRYIAQRLPWIKYHDLTHAGHLFAFADGMTDTILKTLLNVED
ncbi:hypothetical protein L1987_65009 [Smallanthus sonchifolius]|uniref:Uncharacterized protein n=1 Tax=Smallanthus sonchifolius TaxID=185202 RepID=A0ACB9BTI0_9ASTR|nr:hypothetical protein L1987_65009 [Smallanthus sonchifolius]